MKKIEALLTIAGFDPTGGAGILRDILTFKHFGHYSTAVTTANTAQNTKGVRIVHFEPPKIIKKQLLLIFEEFKIKGVKIGLPHKNIEFNKWLATFLKRKKVLIVFDPVIKPTSGKNFVENINTILPLIETSTIITPNEKEFESLEPFINPTNIPYTTIKGKKGNKQVKDLLLKQGEIIKTVIHKKDSLEIHGTGCAFSSALLSLTTKGENIETAFKKATEFLSNYRKKATNGLKQGIYTE